MLRLFEEDLNKILVKDKTLKQKHLKVQVVFIPVTRGELLPALAAGKGDIAASNLTVTEERQKLVDFSSPVYPNVSEVVVSGPASPAVSSVEDLAGKEVFVRKSSSYYESLQALNRRFTTEQRPLVNIKEVSEALEDEDLIEMVNAGLIPLIVVDKHIADLWKQIFPKITAHDGVAVRTGGDIAVAIRMGSPQIKAALDDFVVRHGKGTLLSRENPRLCRGTERVRHFRHSVVMARRFGKDQTALTKSGSQILPSAGLGAFRLTASSQPVLADCD
jgi:membrane-bound lytic murein transglycosylase MltF